MKKNQKLVAESCSLCQIEIDPSPRLRTPACNRILAMAPAKCVTCQKDNKTRLLSCLHVLCMTCLVENTRSDSDASVECISCPACGKRTPLAVGWSPSAYSKQLACEAGSRSGSAAVALLCEECGDDEIAEFVCEECDCMLCTVHAEAHPRTRATFKHKVTGIHDSNSKLSDGNTPADDDGAEDEAGQPSGNASAPQAQGHNKHRCSIHPSKSVSHFCIPCNKLLCAVCMQQGVHTIDSHAQENGAQGRLTEHAPRPIQEAAGESREKLLENLLSTVDGRWTKAIASVRTSMQTLHEQTESASEQAVEFYDTLREEITKRQTRVLAELDERRTTKLQPLERQLSTLLEAVKHGERITEIVNSCDDNTDFLKMRSWLDSTIDDAKRSTQDYLQPCVSSAITFAPTVVEDLFTEIIRAGYTLDFADGRLECSNLRYLGEDATVTIQPKCSPETKLQLTLERIRQHRINVIAALEGENDDDGEKFKSWTEYAVTRIGNDGTVHFAFTPQQAGLHWIFSRIQDVFLRSVSGHICERAVFDENQCYRSIHISNEGHTARQTKPGGGNSKAVCTGQVAEKTGISYFRAQIDQTREAHILLCVCSAESPQLDSIHSDKAQVFGWYGMGASSIYPQRNGGALGQKWKAGDQITLALDHDKHTLTGRHHRTGVSEVLHNIPTTGTLRWYVTLYETNDQITIV
eukprot:scpid48192/ scgid32727/ E3 ubiquitin-protein ligase TRIM33; Ectodermin homolog; RET-fused gene 7 protein; Transcription intermediary factor 1-gamma; Tripartite motif-containing protein 33